MKNPTRSDQLLREITRKMEAQQRALNRFAIVTETDSEGRITYVNDQFCIVTGYRSEEVLGRNHRELVGSRYHPAEFWKQMWETVGRGEIWRADVRNRAKDGSIHWLDTVIVPMLDPRGHPDRYLAIRFPITERKLAEEKAEESIRAKSEFVSKVSHELRTPLAAIKGGVDIVLDGTMGPINAEQQKYLQISKRNIDRLRRLIDDVLSFQRLAAGREEFRLDLQDMRALIRETVQTFQQVARKKGLALEADLAEPMPDIACDRDKITEVLNNLVSNAIKFTTEGRVMVRGELGDNWAKVSVRDSGPGIQPEDQAKLFQSFTQLFPGGTRKTGGTGLGLAISKGIIEAHHGRIGVESAPGQGATFYFILPVTERRRMS
jgi:PAS domain S-box-containing protein